MEKREYGDGETIYGVGDAADGIYVVKKGIVEFSAPMGEQEFYAGQLKEGDIFGEYACIHNSPRLVSAKAVEKVELAFLDKDKLLKAFDNPVAADVARLLCDRIEMLFQMVSGTRDPFRRAGDESRTVIVRPGNLIIENEVIRYSVRIEELPFSLTTIAGNTIVERGGIQVNAGTAKTRPGNSITIKLVNSQLCGMLEFGEGSINQMTMSDAGGTSRIQLQAGPNVLVLGDEKSLARFIVTIPLN